MNKDIVTNSFSQEDGIKFYEYNLFKKLIENCHKVEYDYLKIDFFENVKIINLFLFIIFFRV
jgi:hypothetical protein